MSTESTESVTQPSINVEEEIEKLKAEKEAILQAQEEQSKQLEELNKLKAEIAELKNYTFPQEQKVLTPLEQIKEKYDRVIAAIDQGFPVGHSERLLPSELTYNGVTYLDGFYDYVNGKDLQDIFKDPLK